MKPRKGFTISSIVSFGFLSYVPYNMLAVALFKWLATPTWAWIACKDCRLFDDEVLLARDERVVRNVATETATLNEIGKW